MQRLSGVGVSGRRPSPGPRLASRIIPVMTLALPACLWFGTATFLPAQDFADDENVRPPRPEWRDDASDEDQEFADRRGGRPPMDEDRRDEGRGGRRGPRDFAGDDEPRGERRGPDGAGRDDDRGPGPREAGRHFRHRRHMGMRGQGPDRDDRERDGRGRDGRGPRGHRGPPGGFGSVPSWREGPGEMSEDGPPPMRVLIHMMHGLRQEIAQLREEVHALRGAGNAPREQGEMRREPQGQRGDGPPEFRGPPGGRGRRDGFRGPGPRRDGEPRREGEPRQGPPGEDNRPGEPPARPRSEGAGPAVGFDGADVPSDESLAGVIDERRLP